MVSPPGGHQNAISVVPHFRPNGSLTYLRSSGYHQSVGLLLYEKDLVTNENLNGVSDIYSSTMPNFRVNLPDHI